LARIHRLTLEGLRRQIEPVSVEQFMRFLVRYQHLQPETKLRGQAGVLRLIEQLEGFEAPAGHWEKYILPARLESYEPSWLDTLTFMGQAAWGRLRPVARTGEANGRPMKALTRSTPITLMLREHAPWLLSPPDQLPENPALDQLGSNARAAYEAFTRHGALFPAQIGQLLQLMPSQVEDVLGELAAAGLVTSDGYPALRTILGLRAQPTRRRKGRPSLQSSPPAGRWTLLRSPLLPSVEDEKRVDNWCRLLLRRYGVVFRELLANDAAAPRWGELIRVYRRLEARGEIRYGRFVDGVAGEQFALPETIPLLRAGGTSSAVELPATDPINLTGRVMAGGRVPALPGHSIAIVNGAVQPQTACPN
jgi:ATP-dependent Lhr-like helicase